MQKKRNLSYIFPPLIFILIFIAAFLLRNYISAFITSSIELYGVIFIFLVVLILEISPQYVGPHFVLVTSILLGFSPIKTIIATIIGSAAGAIGGYEIGRIYGKKLSRNPQWKEKINSIEKYMKKYGKFIVLIAALTPFPYFPAVFGYLRISREDFALFGMLPRALSFYVLGTIVSLI